MWNKMKRRSLVSEWKEWRKNSLEKEEKLIIERKKKERKMRDGNEVKMNEKETKVIVYTNEKEKVN